MIQSIWQSSTSLTWTDSIVVVKDVLGNLMSCGSLVYEFLDSSSTPFASTSEISYNVSTKTFSMQTNLPASAASTSLKIQSHALELGISPRSNQKFSSPVHQLVRAPNFDNAINCHEQDVQSDLRNCTFVRCWSFHR